MLEVRRAAAGPPLARPRHLSGPTARNTPAAPAAASSLGQPLYLSLSLSLSISLSLSLSLSLYLSIYLSISLSLSLSLSRSLPPSLPPGQVDGGCAPCGRIPGPMCAVDDTTGAPGALSQPVLTRPDYFATGWRAPGSSQPRPDSDWLGPTRARTKRRALRQDVGRRVPSDSPVPAGAARVGLGPSRQAHSRCTGLALSPSLLPFLPPSLPPSLPLSRSHTHTHSISHSLLSSLSGWT